STSATRSSSMTRSRSCSPRRRGGSSRAAWASIRPRRRTRRSCTWTSGGLRHAGKGRYVKSQVSGLKSQVSRLKSQVLRLKALAVAFVLVCAAGDASAYSVLTHEANIDTLWDSHIRPLLARRFPRATAEELKHARAFAYGGSVIQDL